MQNHLQYFNRQLSWLSFNNRVLNLASDLRLPVLERMKFLAIVSSNLDEFFEIRVAGLMQQAESGNQEIAPDSLSATEQLEQIRKDVLKMVSNSHACWKDSIVPELEKQNIFFKKFVQLNNMQKSWVKKYFAEQVYPILTPMALDPAHPFPNLRNKGLNILVQLKKNKKELTAIIPVPKILKRIIEIPTNGQIRKNTKRTIIFLEDIIKRFAQDFFSGYKVQEAHAFRITRNSDLYLDEEEAENILKLIEEELHKRKKGNAVRLEIESSVSEKNLGELLEDINLSEEEVYKIDGPINFMRLFDAYELIDRPDLKYPRFHSKKAVKIPENSNIFDVIDKKDILLHHPYDSFSPVVDFLETAAKDPSVLAIKLTLYRTASNGLGIIKALKMAALNGKQVTVVVEIKARFDEENNIHWAKELEETGVHVVYGIVGKKTHSKCCLIVKQKAGQLKSYVHLGTGNYNPKTAKQYTDLSFFTSNASITSEATELFNVLTGYSNAPEFKKLIVAPFNFHSKMQELILNEAKNAKAGKKARIVVKVNSLIDKETIDNLYIASNAGVKIELIIRGICGLVPQIANLSQNIQVKSIVGRFLEHSRIYYFENAGNSLLYAGSGDWMPRNFERRIECIFPIEEKHAKEKLLEILNIFLADNAYSSLLLPSGKYKSLLPEKGLNISEFSSQDYFMKH